jgi:hypothetical protein
MEKLNNKKYSVADWSLIANGVLIIIIILILKGCGDTTSKLNHDLDKAKADIEIQNQSVFKSYSIIDKLNDSIANIQPKIEKVYLASKHIKDTINVTPDSGQYGITKTLCSISNDSVPFREINYCLEEGNTAKAILPFVRDSLNLTKKKEVKYIEIIASKDTVIAIGMDINDKLSNDNFKLENNLFKETRHKKGWRGLSIGLTVLALIGFAL